MCENEGSVKPAKKGKHKKRKPSSGSPSGSAIQPAEKRSATMNDEQCSQLNGQINNGQINHGGQQNDVFVNPISQSYSQLLTQPPPQYFGMSMGSSSVPGSPPPAASCNNQLLERLDSIDNKLKSLDNIEKQLTSMNKQITGIDIRLQENEQSVKILNTKVADLEDSRNFDADVIDKVKKTESSLRAELEQTKKLRTDITTAAEVRDKMKSDYLKLVAENEQLRAEITDIKGRDMRNNLLFYNFPEQVVDRKHENCEEKVLQFCELELNMPHVRTDFPMERVHRIGEFKPNKIRPIVAKFLNYKHKEEVKSAGITKLSNSRFSVGDQFPKPVQEKRRALLPVKKAALKKGDTAVFAYDKLYINGVLYKPPVNKDTQKAGNNRTPGQLTGSPAAGDYRQLGGNQRQPPWGTRQKTPPSGGTRLKTPSFLTLNVRDFSLRQNTPTHGGASGWPFSPPNQTHQTGNQHPNPGSYAQAASPGGLASASGGAEPMD